MAFNKKETLEGNIRAIKLALELEKSQRKPTAQELETLQAYKGFGGLKCVLLPTHLPNSEDQFPASEKNLFPLVKELNDFLGSELPTREAMEMRSSIKNSVFTAFYTPKLISESISSALGELGLTQGVKRILDPSAGLGSYSNPYEGTGVSVDAYEKDRLTGLILKHVKAGNPAYHVSISDFESMRPIQMNSYDLVVSNIPFGNIPVYDKEYDRQKGSVEEASQRAIHDYFFVKGINALKRGGTLAFITSRGSMDSQASEQVRRYLMERAELVSAVRLPDGLFRDEAGTDAGSDLIILRRRTEDKGREDWTEAERDFVELDTRQGISLNRYFSKQTEARVLADDVTIGTNQYGKPTFKYSFWGDEEVLARALKQSIISSAQSIRQEEGVAQNETAQQEQSLGNAYDLLPKDAETLLPPLYSEEETPVGDKVAYVRYFHPLSSYTAYLLEYNPETRIGFGLVSMDYENWSFGNISLDEIESVKVDGLGIERDLVFSPRKLSEIEELQELVQSFEIEDVKEELDEQEALATADVVSGETVATDAPSTNQTEGETVPEGISQSLGSFSEKTPKESESVREEISDASAKLLELFSQAVEGKLGAEEASELFQGLISEAQHRRASLPSREAEPSEELVPIDAEHLFSHPRTASNIGLYLLEQSIMGQSDLVTAQQMSTGLYAMVRAKGEVGWDALEASQQADALALARLAYGVYIEGRADAQPLEEALTGGELLHGIYDRSAPKDHQNAFIDLAKDMSTKPQASPEAMRGYTDRMEAILPRPEKQEEQLVSKGVEVQIEPTEESTTEVKAQAQPGAEPKVEESKPRQEASAPTPKQTERRARSARQAEQVASPNLFDELFTNSSSEEALTSSQTQDQSKEEESPESTPTPEAVASSENNPKAVTLAENRPSTEALRAEASVPAVALLSGKHAPKTSKRKGGKDLSGRVFDLEQRPIDPWDLEPHHFVGSLVMLPSEEQGKEPYIGFLRTDDWGGHYLEPVNPEGIKTYYVQQPKDKSKEPVEKVKITPVDWDRLVAYLEVRDAYHRLYARDVSEMNLLEQNPETESLRREFSELYDAFYREYGLFNHKDNEKYLIVDPHFSEVKALEWEVDKEQELFCKADIFDHSTLKLTDSTPQKVSSTTDALSVSLDRKGAVDLPFMQSLLEGKTEDDLKSELEGRIFYDYESKSYKLKEHLIYGNVIDKIDKVNAYLKSDPADKDEVVKTLRALEEARPATIPFEEIGLQFGERWMPTTLFESYIKQRLNTDDHTFKIFYNKEVDSFEIKRGSYLDGYNLNRVWGVDRVSGYDIISHALHDTVPNFQKEVEIFDPETGQMKKKKVVDHEKTSLATERIQDLRNGFEEFLYSQPQSVKDKLEEMYNRRFNCYVRPEYDGSHQKFPDLDFSRLGWSDLYQSQKDAIWMLVSNGGGVVDHEVGGGKTAIMCCAAYEMKRLGKCKKPLMIGLKANCEEIAQQFKKSYPNARVLYATENDLTPSNRLTFINKIKAFEWDCVIMTHEQFAKIPQPLDIQEKFLREEQQAMECSIDFLRKQVYYLGGSGAKQAYSRVERTKLRIERQLMKLRDKRAEQTDKVVDFAALGFDHIFVDESHKFKNLSFQSRHTNVAGLGSVGKGSDRADNLLFAIRTIQERTGKDLGATFLSGTTISNSISELYLIFKYLRPNTLREAGLDSFDAWASVFAKKTVDFEFTLTGEVKQKERFRTYCKIPELTTFYREICDFRRAEDIGLDRPKANIQLVNLKPTEDQLDFGKKLIDFVKTGNHAGLELNKPTKASYADSAALMATNYGRLMGVDMRLLDPDKYDDHPDNKASACAHRLAEIYNRSKDYKGTQFVFTNVGVYKPGNTGNFDVCSEIKRKLVEDYGIPDKEIAFISDGTNEEKRKAIINRMNQGDVRILFGSTEKLGTGVNAQERAVAVHHLDIPYVPSAMEQRNGRAVRKGNEVAKAYNNNQVDIFCYAHERTIEAALFQLLDVKATFIEQIKTGKTGARVIRDDMDENNQALGYAEIVAAISGDNTLLEKAKLDQKILRLESSLKGHKNVVYKAKEEVERLEKEIRSHEEKLPQIRKDVERLKAIATPDEKGYLRVDREQAILSIEGLPEGASKKAISDKLLELASTTDTGGRHITIGTLGDFPLVMVTKKVDQPSDGNGLFSAEPRQKTQNEFFVKAGSGLLSPNHGLLYKTEESNADYFARALEKLPKIESDFSRRLEVAKTQLPVQKELSSSTWKHHDELKEARAELKVLQARLAGQAEKFDEDAKAIRPPKPRL